MCVLAVHVVRYDDQLHDVRMERFESVALLVRVGRHVEGDPPVRLVEREDADVLQVARACACADGDGGGRVGVVEREAQADAEFLYGDLAGELQRDEVWLGTVRVPERVRFVVAQAFGPKAELVRGHGPLCEVADVGPGEQRGFPPGVHEQRAVHGQLRHDEAVQRGQAERAYAGHLSGTGWWCMQWYLLYARSEPVCKASTEEIGRAHV